MALRFFLSVCKILGKSPNFPPMSLYEEVSYLVVFICACSVWFLCFNSGAPRAREARAWAEPHW